jgi:Fic family protein
MYNHPRQMTPHFPQLSGDQSDQIIELIKKSSELGGMLHPDTRQKLKNVLKITNSYYSNLIEGNKTTPYEIEQAMHNDYSDDPVKRELQLESKIHVDVQNEIEQDIVQANTNIVSQDFLKTIHLRFYSRLPQKYQKDIMIQPGEFRNHEVVVGKHVAPAHETITKFLKQFEALYSPKKLHGIRKYSSAAASHHRLTWIHPFSDGNGRVSRLFSDTYLSTIEPVGYGLWRISRGFARNKKEYLSALSNADLPRQGDLDGRGNLSQKGLNYFCSFFWETCMDQVSFISHLLHLEGMLDRIKGYVQMRNNYMIPDTSPIQNEAIYLLQEAFVKGKFNRGEASRITNLPERTARSILSRLVKERLLTSETPKGPVSFGFPVKVIQYLIPGIA